MTLDTCWACFRVLDPEGQPLRMPSGSDLKRTFLYSRVCVDCEKEGLAMPRVRSATREAGDPCSYCGKPLSAQDVLDTTRCYGMNAWACGACRNPSRQPRPAPAAPMCYVCGAPVGEDGEVNVLLRGRLGSSVNFTSRNICGKCRIPNPEPDATTIR